MQVVGQPTQIAIAYKRIPGQMSVRIEENIFSGHWNIYEFKIIERQSNTEMMIILPVQVLQFQLKNSTWVH